ncbi:MAG: cohesin domain-containing protein [Methanomicrobiales archaeon]|nr:cohesin domain-containing protein [Methanomicrobiales archaeon]
MYRLDLTLSYDPGLCTAVNVLPGDFAGNTTLNPALDRGEVRLTVVSADGIGGNGIVAWVRFRVLASSGSSALRLLSARTNHPPPKGGWRIGVILGVSFSKTAEGRQRISVDTRNTSASIEDNSVSFSQREMTILFRLKGSAAPRRLLPDWLRMSSSALRLPLRFLRHHRGLLCAHFSCISFRSLSFTPPQQYRFLPFPGGPHPDSRPHQT